MNKYEKFLEELAALCEKYDINEIKAFWADRGEIVFHGEGEGVSFKDYTENKFSTINIWRETLECKSSKL